MQLASGSSYVLVICAVAAKRIQPLIGGFTLLKKSKIVMVAGK